MAPEKVVQLRSRKGVHHLPPVIVSLGMLLMISVTAKAGITVSGGNYKGITDPRASYTFSAYLDPGSTLAPGSLWPIALPSSFTLNHLIGIDGLANISITDTPSGVSWLPVFGIPQKTELIVGGVDYGSYEATSVTFFYTGCRSFTNSSGSLDPLGQFTITEPCYSIPALPTGGEIPVTYSFQTKDSSGSNSLEFTVVPEPSSLVVVALASCSFLGFSFLRRRRGRAA
jgi:hypothetical protein